MTGIQATTEVIDRLLLDTTLTSLLSSKDSHPCIISGLVLPDEWKATDKTINVYVITENIRLEYNAIRLAASCRGNTYAESREIAYALCDCLNRTSERGLSIVTNLSVTIEPSDVGMQNYLTVVEIYVRS